MSTFNGIVREFPEIRIDFFRLQRGLKPPSACFLSHIHSDHLQGLDSPVLPFIYCSAATKRLLLRMEKYPHRINFAKGILEARKQTYKHLRKVLKALPLQTPTTIELTPKTAVRVTLFDANHCPGAVMFLVEGDGRAILYTGDVRSEPWWVNSLVRHPAIIPYTMGRKRLDCLYVDTTFATKEDVYKDFPSKASGLAELIEKVEQYPPETIFYFRAWTLGYEDAWVALSSTLDSRIHVDAYQTRLYSGLLEDYGEKISVQEAASLVGFAAGNHAQEGCLTDGSTVPVRIHSCEPGTACHTSISKKPNLVWITPIISRTRDGTELYEIGAGGGGGDLYQTPELEFFDRDALQALQALCADSMTDPLLLDQALEALKKMSSTDSSRVKLDGIGIDLDPETDLTLKEFINLISNSSAFAPNSKETITSDAKFTTTIRFPYSRHSSCNELRELVAAFKPRDICPCAVDSDNWNEDVSMQSLFGDLCSEQIFFYDTQNRVMAEERRELLAAKRKRKRDLDDDGETQRSQDISNDTYETAEDEQNGASLTTSAAKDAANKRTTPPLGQQHSSEELDTPGRRLTAIAKAFQALKDDAAAKSTSRISSGLCLPSDEQIDLTAADQDCAENEESIDTQASLSPSAFESQPPTQLDSSRVQARIEAYQAAKAGLDGDHSQWNELGLRSIGYSGHVDEEIEL